MNIYELLKSKYISISFLTKSKILTKLTLAIYIILF